MADLVDAQGHVLGAGIFDPQDPVAAWRRFSLVEEAEWDADYLASALMDSIERRSGEACQCLVSSDADFLPGLIVERYGEVLRVQLETAAMQAHSALVLELLQETLMPQEMVLMDAGGIRTLSGNPLKPRWIEIDDLAFRVDLSRPEGPGFSLILREQHALFGSLCEGRHVLECFAEAGAFSIHAMAHGAASATALQPEEGSRKGIGAQAQRNGHRVEARASEPQAFLGESGPGIYDAIVGDLRHRDLASRQPLIESMVWHLDGGGLLVLYSDFGTETLGEQVTRAVAAAGREARVFARTSQPFDYPLLLSFPESQLIEGLILEIL